MYTIFEQILLLPITFLPAMNKLKVQLAMAIQIKF